MKYKILSIILIFLLIFTLTGCNTTTENKQDKKIIAVSIAPQATFLEKICEDDFEIVTTIPAGASPETYEPTPKEMEKLSDSLIYFALGVPAEQTILNKLPKTTRVIKLQDLVNDVYPDIKIGDVRDPHIWLSIKRACVIVSKMEEVLSNTDSKNSDLYKKNAKNYILELNSLDNQIKDTFKNCKSNKFIVFHPSFSYFAEDYGLKMYALEHEGKEATAKRIADMIDFAKEQKINTIFYQIENPTKQVLAFAEEIDGKAIMLEPLSPDYINNIKKMAYLLSEAMK